MSARDVVVVIVLLTVAPLAVVAVMAVAPAIARPVLVVALIAGQLAFMTWWGLRLRRRSGNQAQPGPSAPDDDAQRHVR